MAQSSSSGIGPVPWWDKVAVWPDSSIMSTLQIGFERNTILDQCERHMVAWKLDAMITALDYLTHEHKQLAFKRLKAQWPNSSIMWTLQNGFNRNDIYDQCERQLIAEMMNAMLKAFNRVSRRNKRLALYMLRLRGLYKFQ